MKLFGIDIGYGNSVKDKLYWLITGFMTRMGFIVWGGSPPPPAAPTQTTVTNTNIPDYAQPYVLNMLNAAQSQIYNPSGTGFNPYVPYSGDPRNYVAGFSPLQQQAQSTAANMQIPSQYGIATGQTLGATGAMGRLAPQLGMAGANYAAQATSPYATAAYMNPYVASSLAPQLALANQQYGIAGQREGSAAAQAGAFGGSRQALANALNQQNQMLAQNQLISQGYNTAFQNAQQAQQFGANLGLQGQQAQLAALQGQLGGANQLAGIGGAELAAQQGIAGLQNQYGQQQQQQQQNIINQAVQNYATAQQYPYMQLGVLNSMLRGLPMQQTSTQMYQAAPSPLSQLAGLGTAAYGAYKTFGQKEGGLAKVKKMAFGGSAIPMDHYSNQQLEDVKRSQSSSLPAKMNAQNIENLRHYDYSNPEASKLLSQPLPTQDLSQAPAINPQQLAMAPRVGIGSIATNPAMTQMAGGGIIAFADEGLVKDEKKVKELEKEIPTTNIIPANILDEYKSGIKLNNVSPNVGLPNLDVPHVETPKTEAEKLNELTAGLPSEYKSLFDEAGNLNLSRYMMHELTHPDKSTTEALQKSLEDYNRAIDERNKTSKGEAILRAGLGIMAGTSPHALVNIGAGAPAGLDFMSKIQEQNEADRNAIAKLTYEGAKADDQRKTEIMNKLIQGQYLSAIADKKNQMLQAGLYTPDALNDMVDQYLAGDKSVTQNMGYGPIAAENRKNFRETLSHVMHQRGFSGSDVAGKILDFNSLSAGARTTGVRGANIELAGQGFTNIVPIALKASENVSRSGFLPFGKVEIMFNEQTNNPDLAQFAAANNGLVNTYSRAISPTGVPSVNDKIHARKILSEAKSPEAYQAAVKTLLAEIEAEKRAPHEVRQKITSELTSYKTPPVTNKPSNINENKATSGNTYKLTDEDLKLTNKYLPK